MPVGVITNALAIVCGGLLGSVFGHKLSTDFKEKLNLIFAVCSLGIGISATVLMVNMPAVVLSLIVGTIVGLTFHLEQNIARAGSAMQKLIPGASAMDEATASLLVTTIVLFCSSGTGIFGAIVSGMSGDHSILIAKSILDFFTAMIFACTLGNVVCLIAVPQFLIFLLLFICAKVIYPLTTPAMINDFKACGGLIMVATGFRISKVKNFPIADMIPAMLLVWFMSAFWTGVINPLLAGL